MLFSSTAVLGLLALASFVLDICAQGSGTPKILWSKETPPQTLGINPFGSSIFAFGISFIERSPELVSDRDFLVTGLEVLENIYNTRTNRSALVKNYAWVQNPPSPVPLNISAVGRGLEEGIPITFTGAALVRFVRWLGQISQAHAWQTFHCYYHWIEHGKQRSDLVAVGNFTSFTRTGDPPELIPAVLS